MLHYVGTAGCRRLSTAGYFTPAGAKFCRINQSPRMVRRQHPPSTAGGDYSRAALAIAAGLAIAIGAFGAALGQGRMAAAAMESIGRNPNAADRIQLPMILGLAFIEALALYAFVIAFFLQGKI